MAVPFEEGEKTMKQGWFHRAEARGRGWGEWVGRLLDRLLRPRWSSAAVGGAEALILEMELALERAVDPQLTLVKGRILAPSQIELRLPYEVASRFEGVRWPALRQRLIEHLTEFLRDRRCQWEQPLQFSLEIDPFLRRPEVRFPAESTPPERPAEGALLLIEQRTRIVHRLSFASPGAVVGIGRNPANGVVLEDPTVSSFHAAVRWRIDGGFELADCGGVNGTFLNGLLLPEAGSVRIADGDLLRVGDLDLRCSIDPTGRGAEDR